MTKDNKQQNNQPTQLHFDVDEQGAVSLDERPIVVEQPVEQPTPTLTDDHAQQQQIFDEQAPSPEQIRKQQAKEQREKVFNIVLWMVIAVLSIVVFLRAFIASKVTVSGDSMLNTYKNGDVVVVNKVDKIERGDVVVFFKYDVENKLTALFAKDDDYGGKYQKLIKRAVAVAGDKIWVEQVEVGQYRLVILTADGTTLYEDYYMHATDPVVIPNIKAEGVNSCLGCLAGTSADNPIVIMDGHFFALGDNRDNSADSRGELGQVPVTRLYGVVMEMYV